MTDPKPLNLTVHDLADPNPAALQSRGRLKMLMVLLLCASPVIASYLTYYVVRPEGRRNYGELVAQRAMPADLRGVPVQSGVNSTTTQPLSRLRDQWLLISVSGGACDAACERHLYLQRQMRESLGKNKDRLDWVWLVTDDAPIRPQLLAALAGAVVWRVPPQALAAWLTPQTGRRLSDHLYVIDPIGNWMLRFPPELDPPRAKRDMERLLRASGAWDTAGRSDAAAAKLPLGAPLRNASEPTPP